MNYDEDFDGLEFEVKEIHLKLLDQTYIEWNEDSYDGYVAMDPKRPYGNSSRIHDIIDLMRTDKEFEYLNFANNEDPELTDEQEVAAMDIHRQMFIIFKILIDTKSIKTGIYKRNSHKSWEDSKWYLKDSKLVDDTNIDTANDDYWEFENKNTQPNISINKNGYNIEIVENSIKITIKDQ